MWVGRVHGVFETGSIVDRPAPGIGDQKLDSVRQPLLHESLERVIGRVRDRHRSENAAEHRNSVRRTARTCGGFAERRRVLAKPNQRNRIRIRTSYGRHRAVGQVQRYARRNGTGGNGVVSVRSKRPTQYSRNLTQVETGLGIAVILVQGSQQPVPLRAHVSKLPERFSCQLALVRSSDSGQSTDRTRLTGNFRID